MKKFELTQEWLKEHFDYNAESGAFTRIKGYHGNCKVGFSDWGLNGYRYRSITLDGKNYLIHRLVWLWMYGYSPKEIDHINHNTTDNRLCNLRSVSRVENTRNAKKRIDNTSGIVGVSWVKKINRWRSRISHRGKRIFLGTFKCFNQAVAARKSAEKLYGYHSNHGA